MMRMPQSVRWRLAIWYASTLAVVLGASAFLSLRIVRSVLDERTDHFLQESRRGFLSVLTTEEREYPDSQQAIEAAVAEIGFVDTRLLVINAEGAVVGVSAARGLGATPSGMQERQGELAAVLAEQQRQDASVPKPLAEAIHVVPHQLTVPIGEGFRMAFSRILLHGRPYTVAAVRSLDDLIGTMNQVRHAYLIAIPVVLIAATAGGYVLARRAMAPVSAMARRAQAISASTLHERLPLANPADELGELGGVMNGLLARLEAAFSRQRQLVADASHELRTPVAVLLAESEVTLSRASRPEGEYRDSLQVIRNATLRLSRIVEDLFVLASSDGGRVPHRDEALYLDEVADDCVRAMQTVAKTHDVRLRTSHAVPAPDGALLRGDPELLGRLVFNLVDNAIKYSPRGGTVLVSVGDAEDRWTLTVSDQGPGVAAELRPHIFERFVRGDAARARSAHDPRPSGREDGVVVARASGAGLGLAIARLVAEHHGGTLVLTRSDDTGSEFTAHLPKVSPFTSQSHLS
jgi:signal transduction histidine kinase